MIQDMTRSLHRTRGFSLVELAIVMVVAAVVVGGASSAVSEGVQDTRRLRTRNLLIEEIRAARDRAVWTQRSVHVWYQPSGLLEIRDMVQNGQGCSWGLTGVGAPRDILDLNGLISSIAGTPSNSTTDWDLCFENTGFVYTDAPVAPCVTSVAITFRARDASSDDTIFVEPTGLVSGSWELPSAEGLASVNRHGGRFTPINHDARVNGANCSGSVFP